MNGQETVDNAIKLITEEKKVMEHLYIRLGQIRKAGEIVRYHNELLVRPQTVAEHSYGVACLVDLLTSGSTSQLLLRCALYHDTPEVVTGDIPAPVLWNGGPDLNCALDLMEKKFRTAHGIPDPEELMPAEQLVLRWADKLDLLIYCYEEKLRGNQRVDKVFWAMVKYIESLGPHPIGKQIFDKILWARSVGDATYCYPDFGDPRMVYVTESEEKS